MPIFQVREQWRRLLAAIILSLCASLIFFGSPLQRPGPPHHRRLCRAQPTRRRAPVWRRGRIDPFIGEHPRSEHFPYIPQYYPAYDPTGLHSRVDLCLCPPHDQSAVIFA